MKKALVWLLDRILIAGSIVGSIGVAAAIANYAVTAGSGLTFGSVVVGGVHYAQQFICDLTTPAQCASVSAGGALKVDGSAVTQPVSGTVTAAQATAANFNATVVGTGIFVTQATLPAETTKVIGTVRNLGNAGAAFDAATAAAVPANALYAGINVAGNMRGLTGLALGSTFSPTVAIVDASGNQVTTFGGSGGTALADEGTFTQGTTNATPISCLYSTAVVNLTNAQAGAVRCTNDRQFMVSDSALLAAVQAAIPAGTNIIGKVGIDQTTDGTTNAVHLVAGTALAGKFGIDQTTNGTTNGVRNIAGATGGGTVSSAIAPATPAGVNLKASAGTVFKVFGTTIQSTPVYVKLYNASSAPTCGSGTPIARFMIPAASTAANGAGNNIDIGDIGAAFGTGIGYCVTGALADNDTTAITANNTLVNIVWN